MRTKRHRTTLLLGLSLGPWSACAESNPGPVVTAPAPTEEPDPAVDIQSSPRPVVQGPKSRATTPKGAALDIGLEAEGDRFFLGENILIHFVVANPGTSTVSIGWGGDYRGGSRHARYRMEVTAEDGTAARDPDPSHFNMGGMGGDYEIEPGERYVDTLALIRYAQIERPGRYRIRVMHDLGWGPSEETVPAADDPRWSEITLELAMPSATEAASVVKRMRALSEGSGVSLGEPRPPYPDYSALQHRPYLPILRHAVVEDRAVELIDGIAMMPHPEATEVLIDLAGHPEPEVATTAIDALLGRMPKPTGPNARESFMPRDFSRDFLHRRAWLPRHEPPVRRIGHALLSTTDPENQRRGAAISESIGTPEDFAAMVLALDRALERSEANGATKHYPHPATPHGSLIRVIESLIEKGAAVGASPSSPGMIAAYLVRWGKAHKRPADYAERAAGWMRHPIPFVRELAVDRTKDPLPPAMQDELLGLLESDQLSLQVHACDAMAGLRQRRFAASLLKLAATAEDEWLLRAIESATIASGVPRTRIMGVWASRLDQPGVGWRMFAQLIGLLAQSGGNGFGIEPSKEEARRLKREWTAFLKGHATAIDKGAVFSLDGPEYTPALVPKGTELSPK